MKGSYGVVIFYSTSAALRAESLAKRANLKIKLIPVPRYLSSDCGVCLRFESEERAALQKILQEGKVEYKDICNL